MFIILVMAIFGYRALATELPYNDCSPVGSYKVDRIVMNLECLDSICCLPVKRQAQTTISFQANNIKAEDLTPRVFADLAGTLKDVDVTPKNCPPGVCPIYQNERRDYSAAFTLNFHVDPIWVQLRWEAYNHVGTQLFCFEIPFVVYNPDTDECPLFGVKRYPKLLTSRLSKPEVDLSA